MSGLFIVPILAVLILVHEIGHFVSARLVGVTVEEFGIGLPPRLYGWRRNGVIWSLNWIPFGGFVRVLGEDGRSMAPGSMNAKSPLQRAFFLVAGSAMNFLLAIVLMVFVLGVQGDVTPSLYISAIAQGSPAAKAGWQVGDHIVEVNGKPVARIDDIRSAGREFGDRQVGVVIERHGKLIDTTVTPRAHPPEGEQPIGIGLAGGAVSDVIVSEVVADSPAAEAGLQPGDKLVTINDRPAAGRFVVTEALERFKGFSLPVTVERNGETQALTIAVPRTAAGTDPLTPVGFSATITPIFHKLPAAEIIPRGIDEAWQQTTLMVGGIRDLITGQAPLNQVAGPIGMGQMTNELVEESPFPLWYTLAQITIVISLNLGVLNLLPLPALDGGRLLFVFVEILRGGRRIAPEREGLVHFAGLVILIGLMVVVAFADIRRIITGG